MTAKITPIHKGNSKTELNNYTDPSQYSAPTPKVAFGVLYKCMARGSWASWAKIAFFNKQFQIWTKKKLPVKNNHFKWKVQ